MDEVREEEGRGEGRGMGRRGRAGGRGEGRGMRGEIVIFNIEDRLKHSFSFGVSNSLEIE